MRQYELIADRIEDAIGQMFAAVQSEYTNQFEYSLLFNPNKHTTWFVVLFCPTITAFKKALADGTCYLLYSHLISSYSKEELLPNVDIFTSFDIGNRPTDTEAYDKLFTTLSDKLTKLRNSTQSTNQTTCIDCGHDFNAHQLMTLRNNETENLKEGWIMCPEENCTCFKTWSANYSGG